VPSSITVVIPTHDRRDTMLLALASALNQTREPAQILVVADGCSDGTAEVVRALGDPRVEALDLPKGPGYGYGHRNEALRRVSGDVVAWLADDDLYLTDHLERVGELFDAGVAELVSTPACMVHEDDLLEVTWMDWGIPFYRERFLGGENRTPASAVSHTLRAAVSVGGWRAGLPRAADMDLWQRMLRAGARPVATCAPTVLHFRASGRNQNYADRILQNRSYAERLRRPDEQISLRAEMYRALHGRLAAFEQRASAAEKAQSDAEAAIVRAEEEVRRSRANADAAILHAEEEIAELRSEAERALHTLDAIYAGGWWRLRSRMQPALTIGRRLTRRPST
jgi:glycosyltransferase involved in cell wall biosynthesis